MIGIAVTAAMFGGRASAADLEVAAPPPAVPDWSGPYIGLSASTRHNSVDGIVTSATVGATPIVLPPVTTGGAWWEFWRSGGPSGTFIDNIALRGGVYAGWNVQISPKYVVGVEADFNYANETAAFHGSPYPANLIFGTTSLPFGASSNDGFYVRTTWDGSARLRFGWLFNPSAMLYLTGGLAWAHLEATSQCSGTFTPNVSNCALGNYFGGSLLGPNVITHSATKLGWTAGTGIDVLLGPRWVIRGQYRVSDFGYLSRAGAFNFTDVRACTGCTAANNPLTVSYQLLLVQHNFEIGLAYKFGP